MQVETRPTDQFDVNDGATLPWQDVLASVYRHRRMVLTIVLIGIAAATLRSWFSPPYYEAEGLVNVTESRSRAQITPDAQDTSTIDRTSLEQINAVAALATNELLIREVLLELNGGQPIPATPEPTGFNPLTLPSRLYRNLHDVPTPNPIDERARRLAHQIEVAPLPRNTLIAVRYAHENPVWAANFINTLMKKLISKYTKMYESGQAREFFEAQKELVAERLQAAQAELGAFRAKAGAELLTADAPQLRAQIADLESQLNLARAQLAEVRAGGTTEQMAALSADPAVGALKARIVELEIQRSDLLSRYTATSAVVADLNRQINDARQLLTVEEKNASRQRNGEIAIRRQAVNARISTIQAQLTDYRQKLVRAEEIEPELQKLINQVETQKSQFANYERKEEEARFSDELDKSQIANVVITQVAETPREPQSPNMVKTVSVGAILSLALGVGLAMLRDWLDPSVKSSAQAERLTGLPVLGEIQI